MTEKLPDLVVGMKLWLVLYQNRKSECEVTVTKVGRDYAQLSVGNYRIHKTNWIVDGKNYMSPGKCYISEQAHKDELRFASEWGNFRRAISGFYQIPTGLTLDSLTKAAELLGVSIGNKP